MITNEERERFLNDGYLVVEDVLQGDHLETIRETFDEAWEANGNQPCSQHELLRYQPFRDLVEHPPIFDRHRAIFGNQTQLLQYDLLRQGPRNETFPDRAWHRDFAFPGDTPLSINTILFIDDISDETGPTRVVPRSHLGTTGPSAEEVGRPIEGEVAVTCSAGTAIFINSAIWHTGGRNESDGLRRGIYLYYGYWWLKRYDGDRRLPWQALTDASSERLSLLGVRMPDSDLHMYDPAR
jgi:ectoine hydroxylase-related dioxygenase (phytanoyl-CoA dioxygenase family)